MQYDHLSEIHEDDMQSIEAASSHYNCEISSPKIIDNVNYDIREGYNLHDFLKVNNYC